MKRHTGWARSLTAMTLLFSLLLSCTPQIFSASRSFKQARDAKEQAVEHNKPAKQTRKISAKSPDEDGDEADSPDIPPFLNERIDETTYHLMRDQQIKYLRGVLDNRKFDPKDRQRAIRMLERQESQHSKALRAERSSQTSLALAQEIAPALSSSTWTPIGPAPIPNGQTTTVSQAVSGRVTSIAGAISCANAKDV